MSMIGCFFRLTDADVEHVVANPEALNKFIQYDPANTDSFDVDKAWQGIHFLLTGSAWEGEGPLAFILHGGREIDQDLGYGPPHAFSAAEVKEIAAALAPIEASALFNKANQTVFAAEEIYPQIWDEPKEDCIGYVTQYFDDLKKFVTETASANRSMVVYLG